MNFDEAASLSRYVTKACWNPDTYLDLGYKKPRLYNSNFIKDGFSLKRENWRDNDNDWEPVNVVEEE